MIFDEVTGKNKLAPFVWSMLYGLEACPLNKADLNSLDFVINRFFMKLFKTSNLDIVRYCQEQFCFELPSVILARRRTKF